MAQFKFILWLAYWYLQTEFFEFEWDVGNISKSAIKHGVSTDDVESVFVLRLGTTIGRQISPLTDEERLCVVGPCQDGHLLSVVFTIRDGRVRPISSRMASHKERRLYNEIRKESKGL